MTTHAIRQHPPGHRSSGIRVSGVVIAVAAIGAIIALTAFTSAPGEAGQSNVEESATPSGEDRPFGTPAPCGAPVDAWGAATADDVMIQLLRTTWTTLPADATPTPARSIAVFAITLQVANLGTESITIDPHDVRLTTCGGREATPIESNERQSLLGQFAPDEARTGIVAFDLPHGDSGARLTIGIQEATRTGAEIACPLVVVHDNATPTGMIAVGCSARGGQGAAGADAVGASGVAPTPATSR